MSHRSWWRQHTTSLDIRYLKSILSMMEVFSSRVMPEMAFFSTSMQRPAVRVSVWCDIRSVLTGICACLVRASCPVLWLRSHRHLICARLAVFGTPQQPLSKTLQLLHALLHKCSVTAICWKSCHSQNLLTSQCISQGMDCYTVRAGW